jgi:hypothetical protein
VHFCLFIKLNQYLHIFIKVSRFFNRTWNYLFKGFIGSLGLLLIFPLICILASISSLFLCVTSPLWYPLVSLAQHLFFVFIYDWEMRKSSLHVASLIARVWQLIVFRLLICGFLQPIAALATALFICPILSLTVATCKRLFFRV